MPAELPTSHIRLESHKVISDLSNTLVKQGGDYDKVLAEVSDKLFGDENLLRINLGVYGNPFPVHIKTVLEHPTIYDRIKDYTKKTHQTDDMFWFSNYLIDNYIREGLVREMRKQQTEACEGLDSFLKCFKLPEIGGIVTGDLVAVANLLMQNNNCTDLHNYFPVLSAGDMKLNNEQITTRLNQVKLNYKMMDSHYHMQLLDPFIMIDDSKNGVMAMSYFAKDYPNASVIGVATGRATKRELLEAGAHAAVDNIGQIHTLFKK